MSPTPRRTRWSQTSLRSLLVLMLVTGAVAGKFGPQLVTAWQEWKPSPPAPPPSAIPAWVQTRIEQEPNGYYESAETPLK